MNRRCGICQGIVVDLPAGSGNFDPTGSTPRSRYVVWRTIVPVPKEKNKTQLPRGRNGNRRRERERYYGTQARPCYSKDGKRKEQKRGTEREMDCRDWRWKNVRRLGKNDATAGISRKARWSDDTMTREWKAGRERRVFFSFTFLSEPRFKGREFNLCKFIMREHFAVYPWKPTTRIHRRACSNSVMESCDREQAEIGVFRSENEWRQKSGDDESVDTCRGIAPDLVSAALSWRCGRPLQACMTT